jgi:hypothetical protein
MAAPIIVSAAEQWPNHEERFIVEYIDLEGDPTGTAAAATVVYVPKFGRLQPVGARPFVGAWPSGNATAGVTCAITGAGTAASPWVVTLATTGALAAGVRTMYPLRVVFLPGPP